MQIQCPICHGFKVITETEKVNPKTGTKYPHSKLGKFFGIFFIIATAGSIVISIAEPVLTIPFIFYAVIYLALGIFILKRSSHPDTINKYYNTCQLCGYKWSKLENEPISAIVIPNSTELIQKGAEELRKQQEAAAAAAQAAAAYYEQQRRHNK